jgi:hypothetical protein
MDYESIELNSINDTCGSLIADKIDTLIKNMRINYDHCYDYCAMEELNRVDTCLNLLRTTDRDNFYSIYVGIPVNYEDYHDQRILFTEIRYTYMEYTLVILSDTLLINKCIAIAREPLNRALHMLSRYELCIPDIPKNFSIESYKLLWHNGFNVVKLFQTAQYRYDYDAIKFIISVMTETDVYNALPFIYHGSDIIDILIIDQCKIFNTPRILLLLKSLTTGASLHCHVTVCYYIINIMSYKDGLKYFTELGNTHKSHKILREMLTFYFRPRGAHTKSAAIYNF